MACQVTNALTGNNTIVQGYINKKIKGSTSEALLPDTEKCLFVELESNPDQGAQDISEFLTKKEHVDGVVYSVGEKYYVLLCWNNMMRYWKYIHHDKITKYVQIRENFFTKIKEEIKDQNYVWTAVGSKSDFSDMDINISIDLNALTIEKPEHDLVRIRKIIQSEYSKVFSLYDMEHMFDVNIYTTPFINVQFGTTVLGMYSNIKFVFVNTGAYIANNTRTLRRSLTAKTMSAVNNAKSSSNNYDTIVFINLTEKDIIESQYPFALLKLVDVVDGFSVLFGETVVAETKRIACKKRLEDYYDYYVGKYTSILKDNQKDKEKEAVEMLSMSTLYAREVYHTQGAVLHVASRIFNENVKDNIDRNNNIQNNLFKNMPKQYFVCSIFDNLGFVHEIAHDVDTRANPKKLIDNPHFLKACKYIYRICDGFELLSIGSVKLKDIKELTNKLNTYRKDRKNITNVSEHLKHVCKLQKKLKDYGDTLSSCMINIVLEELKDTNLFCTDAYTSPRSPASRVTVCGLPSDHPALGPSTPPICHPPRPCKK